MPLTSLRFFVDNKMNEGNDIILVVTILPPEIVRVRRPVEVLLHKPLLTRGAARPVRLGTAAPGSEGPTEELCPSDDSNRAEHMVDARRRRH